MSERFAFYTRLATGRNVLLLLALYVFFNGFALPKAAKGLQEASGQPDFRPLDLRVGISPDDAWKAMEVLGPLGREQYRFAETVTDILYPLAYGLFYSMLILFLFQKSGGRLARMRWVAALPFAGVLFDWLENLGIVRVIDAFPDHADGWAQFAIVSGEIKWMFAFIGILASLAGLIGWGLNARSAKGG